MSVHIHIIYGIILFANGLQPSHSHFPFFSKDNKNRKKSRQFAVEIVENDGGIDGKRSCRLRIQVESSQGGQGVMPKKIRPGLSRRDMEMRFAGELCRICHRPGLIAWWQAPMGCVVFPFCPFVHRYLRHYSICCSWENFHKKVIEFLWIYRKNVFCL